MTERNNISVLAAVGANQTGDAAALSALGFAVLDNVYDGESAISTILDKRPDVVLCDLFLPGIDALGVLEEVRAKHWHGIFLAIADSVNDAMANPLMSAGADYFLVRPYSLQYLAHRIDKMAEERRQSPTVAFGTPLQINSKYDLEECVSDLMRQIGVPAHIRGYTYIRKAIMLALENGDILNSITKELYPTIAKSFDTTASRVERAIRHAIEVAWSRGDIEILTSMFGYTIKTSKGKPTNGEFISMVTDRLRMNLRIG